MKIFVFICLICMGNGYPSDTSNDCFNYCLNDGICVFNGNTRHCYCMPGWQGQICENQREYRTIRIDPSQRNQMSSARTPACSLVPPTFCNGGMCQYNGTSFTCACPPDRSGKYCQLKSPCVDYCINGGMCSLDESEVASCTCPTAFSGARCETELTTTTVSTASTTSTTVETTTNALCVAFQPNCGVGTCVFENNAIRCACPSTHTGFLCETKTGITSGPVISPTVGPIVTNPPTVGPIVTNPPTVGPIVTNPPTGGPIVTNPPTGGPIVTNPSSGTDNACASNPCLNSRPCYNNGNTFYCYCGNSFVGSRCETALG